MQSVASLHAFSDLVWAQKPVVIGQRPRPKEAPTLYLFAEIMFLVGKCKNNGVAASFPAPGSAGEGLSRAGAGPMPAENLR